MAEIRTLWEQGSLTTTIENFPSEQVIGHMESSVVGTPGGIMYQHITGIDKLRNVSDCYFLLLYRSGRLIGSIAYQLRKTRTGEIDYKTWYVRYFHIKAPLRNTSDYRLKKKRPLEERSFSLLKDLTHRIHENPERLIDLETKKVPKAVIYATIEADNERSRNFAAIGGYEHVSDVITIIFSRLIKRRRKGIERLAEEDYPEMQKLLPEFYDEHSIYTEDFIFLNGDYYVMREDGRIVAGIQANEELWRVRSVGSKFMDRLVRSLTRLGFVGKRFSYDGFRFLGIEGIYYREGYEKEFRRLLEGVLNLKSQYLAMMVLDARSPEYKMLGKTGRLGPVHRLMGTFRVLLFARFIGLSEKEKEEFLRKPAYLPIYDST